MARATLSYKEGLFSDLFSYLEPFGRKTEETDLPETEVAPRKIGAKNLRNIFPRKLVL